ncbi:MAG TPA: hypothetical protein VGO57_02210 [Verrucomicrobiae bacterium]|jgi:hypothetical protein
MPTRSQLRKSELAESGLVPFRVGQRNFFLGAKEKRVAAFKARRQYGKTTTFGKIAIYKMMKIPNHTVIFGSAKLSLATEIVRKQEQTFDDFGSRADIQREAALFQNLADSSKDEVSAAGQILKVADSLDNREPDNLTKDDFAELFEKRRLEFRIYHSRTSYSRTKVIALTPSAVGETGDMMADEIARIKNWGEVWEAIEPIVSSDPRFRLLLSTTPAPDDTHLAFEMLMQPPGLDLPTCPEGNWFISDYGIPVLRVTAFDAYADGVQLYDTNTGKPVSPVEHRAKARDQDAWDRNYGALDIIGGTGAIGLVEMTAAQIRGEGKCLHVEVRRPDDLEAALAWLEINLTGGPVCCGWDLATTTNETSNPSSFTVMEHFGGAYIERLVCTWKTDSDEVQEARAKAILETVAKRGTRCRRLCIDATNERLFARRMQRQLGRLCTVLLIVGSETTKIIGTEETVNMKTLLGENYMTAFKDGQIDVPASTYIKDDHRMVKKEKGFFVCVPAADGKHGDTFDSGKLAYHGFNSQAGAITAEALGKIRIGGDNHRLPKFTPRRLV